MLPFALKLVNHLPQHFN